MAKLLPLLVGVALASAACKGKDASTTAPTPMPTTDTFLGTVQVRGSAIHTFNVAQSGQVSVTLTAAGPPDMIVMGVGIGTPGDNACGVLPGASVTTAAGSTAQLSGVVSPGMLCATVYDVGNQTAAVNYAITVVHP
jgi:hypothetical protein